MEHEALDERRFPEHTPLGKLERLLVLSTEAGYNTLIPRIHEEIQKLQANKFHLVVLGQFKRGKTTFINALLGEELLPVGVVPVTSIVTLIQYGPHKRFTIVFEDGRRAAIEAGELKSYVTERGNPENRKKVRYAELTHPCGFLKDGIVLVDTPGIGSLFSHNTEATRNFIPNVDAAIVLLSADLPITKAEVEFLDIVTSQVKKLFFVLNKVDLLTTEEIEETLTYTQRVVSEKQGNDRVAIFPVSARAVLSGQTGLDGCSRSRGGFEPLEHAIGQFIRSDKGGVLQERSGDRARAFIAEALFAAELERGAAMTPAVELRQKMEKFDQEIALLKEERETFDYLLQGKITALNKALEASFHRFAGDEIQRLHASAEEWANLHRECSRKEFQRALREHVEAQLVQDFEEWRRREDSLVATEYEGVIHPLVEKTNEFIHRVLQLSASLFQVHLHPFEGVHAMGWKRSFYYTMEETHRFFEWNILKFGIRLLPKSMAHRHIVRRTKTDLTNNVSRHCNTLRYEYEYSLQESYRRFRFDLKEKIDSVIHHIHATLGAAMEMLTTETSAKNSYLQTLEGRVAQLQSLLEDEQVTP